MISQYGILAAIGVGGLTALAIFWCRSNWGRVVLACCSFAVYVLLGLGVAAQLGQPLPWKAASLAGLSQEQEYIVLSYALKENVAIYLWVQIPGEPKPVYISQPWSAQTVKQLMEEEAASKAAHKLGTGTGRLRMKKGPLDDQLDEEDTWVFHPEPVPDNPPKRPETNETTN